jgi:hypothetical protein
VEYLSTFVDIRLGPDCIHEPVDVAREALLPHEANTIADGIRKLLGPFYMSSQAVDSDDNFLEPVKAALELRSLLYGSTKKYKFFFVPSGTSIESKRMERAINARESQEIPKGLVACTVFPGILESGSSMALPLLGNIHQEARVDNKVSFDTRGALLSEGQVVAKAIVYAM